MKKLLGFLIVLCLFLPQSLLAEPLSLNDGSYEVEVSLWHAHEDKLSMGSDGIDKKAELLVKGGEAKLYLSMKPITAFSLTSSLERFFILDKTKGAYIGASPKIFELELSPNSKKRPSLMLVPLSEKADFYSVLVDPGISLMGDDPIKARLHINWESLTPLKEEGSLIAKANLAMIEEASDFIDYTLDKVSLFSAPKDGEFKASPLSRKDLEEKGLKLEVLDKVKGYEVSLLAPITLIPEDKTTNVSSLQQEVVLGEKRRLLFKERDFDEVLVLKEGGFEPLLSQKTEEGLEVLVSDLGVFALLKKGETSKAIAPPVSSVKVKPKVPLAKKPVAKKPIQVKKADRKAVQEKAKALKRGVEDSAQTEKSLPSEPKPRERHGLIVLILGLYALLGLVGLWLLKRIYPSLVLELERRHFIQSEGLKGGMEK